MNEPITQALFEKRLIDLCLRSGMTGMPKDERDQHILLKSMAILIGTPGPFSQVEVDEKLKYWINHLSRIKKLDHATLRRGLVDAGYLARNSDGSTYQPGQPSQAAPQFDPAVDQLDIPAIIQTAIDEIEARKRAFIEKNRQKTG